MSNQSTHELPPQLSADSSSGNEQDGEYCLGMTTKPALRQPTRHDPAISGKSGVAAKTALLQYYAKRHGLEADDEALIEASTDYESFMDTVKTDREIQHVPQKYQYLFEGVPKVETTLKPHQAGFRENRRKVQEAGQTPCSHERSIIMSNGRLKPTKVCAAEAATIVSDLCSNPDVDRYRCRGYGHSCDSCEADWKTSMKSMDIGDDDDGLEEVLQRKQQELEGAPDDLTDFLAFNSEEFKVNPALFFHQLIVQAKREITSRGSKISENMTAERVAEIGEHFEPLSKLAMDKLVLGLNTGSNTAGNFLTLLAESLGPTTQAATASAMEGARRLSLNIYHSQLGGKTSQYLNHIENMPEIQAIMNRLTNEAQHLHTRYGLGGGTCPHVLYNNPVIERVSEIVMSSIEIKEAWDGY